MSEKTEQEIFALLEVTPEDRARYDGKTYRLGNGPAPEPAAAPEPSHAVLLPDPLSELGPGYDIKER